MSARPAKTAMGPRPTISKARQGPASSTHTGNIKPKAIPGGKKMPHHGAVGVRVKGKPGLHGAPTGRG